MQPIVAGLENGVPVLASYNDSNVRGQEVSSYLRFARLITERVWKSRNWASSCIKSLLLLATEICIQGGAQLFILSLKMVFQLLSTKPNSLDLYDL